MDPGLLLIQDFAVLLLVAGLTGLVFRRFGLSVVVGYLAAGMIVGPHTPPFSLVTDLERVQTLSQFGLVFLMFFVGMGLNLNRLKEMGLQPILAMVIGASLVFQGCHLAAAAAGWDRDAALVLAGMLMVSSSAIIGTVFSETGCARESFARRAMGVTVLEDVVAVVMLTLVSARLGGGEGAAGMGTVVGLMAAFVAVAVVANLLLLPRLLKRFTQPSNADLKAVVLTGMVFGAAWVAAQFGYSIALGAFLLGTVAGGTQFRARIERTLNGMHHLFAAVFFVSIGMLIDPRLFLEHPAVVAGVALLALVLRPLASLAAQVLTGVPPRGAVRTSLALVPIGEFSFVIAQMGEGSGRLDQPFMAAAVGASLGTALALPGLVRGGAWVGEALHRTLPGGVWRVLQAYQQWLADLGRFQDRVMWWRLARTRLLQIAAEVLLYAGLLFYAPTLQELIGSWLERSGWTVPGWRLAFFAANGLLALLLAVAAWRNAMAVSMILAEAAAQALGQGSRVAALVTWTARVLMLALLAWIALLAFATYHFALWQHALVWGLVLGLGALFSRRLVLWHSQLRIRMADAIVPMPADDASLARHLGARAQEWNIRVAELEVGDPSSVAGRTLGDLAWRARLGCSVVEILRQGVVIPAPGAGERLFPGDTLLVAGSLESLAQAGRELADAGSAPSSRQPIPELDEIDIPEGPRVGSSLAETGRFGLGGIQVLGWRREGRLLDRLNEQRLQAGDELLVLGPRPELARVKRWLAGE